MENVIQGAFHVDVITDIHFQQLKASITEMVSHIAGTARQEIIHTDDIKVVFDKSIT
jgi:hypothetical protein